ncbi:MAG: response regulator [Lachnospiraceae bacterium]|nr:response regulator [Lachnospiraceae bacterium]
MYKVFIVEDEVIVREGLRDNIPWEQYGYRFVGEAGDGEIALQMIRQERPDVLISDIRMPFMDGLSLCRIVKAELPDIRIVILSGYDDFEYARSAIEIGVDKYLTKPVTRRAVIGALIELSKKLESEKEKEDYIYRQREEMEAYEQFLRRRFFEDTFAGNYSPEQIYREAGKLSIDVTGPYYRVMLFDLFMADGSRETEMLARYLEDADRYFLRHPQYLLTQWLNNTRCVIAKGDRETVEDACVKAESLLERLAGEYGSGVDYFLCISDPTERLSGLKECYEQARAYFSCRYMDRQAHVVTTENYPYIMERTGSVKQEQEIEEGGSDILQEALAYIDAHYTDENISLNTVASRINVSTGYFSAMFSQKMNQTFVEYVTARRMDLAKQLLRTTKNHTFEIAAQTGYKDANYFRYVFKKTVGCTPKEYRNR